MAVNVNNLDQSIAVYRASLITLRDDHTRLGQLICGDSLTTIVASLIVAFLVTGWNVVNEIQHSVCCGA